MKHLPLLMVLMCAFVANVTAKETTTKPNVIVIFVDDMAYTGVSCYGGNIKTPNIDSLAAQGVLCTSGYSTGSMCAPARAGLITGRYQQRFGFYDNLHCRAGVSLDEVTFGDVMKSAGYATAWIGKAHNSSAGIEYHPMNRGFGEFFGFLTGSHDYFDTRYSHEPQISPLLRGYEAVEKEDYLTDAFTREAVSFIERHKDEPFFLYLPYTAPHGPFQAPSRYEGVVFDASKNEKENTVYAMMAAMDEAVGEIIETLKSQKLYENTLVFFINDNGGNDQENKRNPEQSYIADNGPLRGFKNTLFEGGIRVPYIVQWPGVLPPGKVYDNPVITLDVFATAAEVGGVKNIPEVDGVNIIPYLVGEKQGPPHETLYWLGGNGVGPGGKGYAIRKGDYKLVDNTKLVRETLKGITNNKDNPALYNLAEDPGETTNLINEKPALAKELQSNLEEWIRELEPPIETSKEAEAFLQELWPISDIDESSNLLKLEILDDQHPKSFFFRISESYAPDLDWEAWHANFGRLLGLEGKALNEEVDEVKTIRSLEYYNRYKALHPDKLLLLHFNGRARKPHFETEPFFAGNWLYYNGATVESDIPATEDVTTIKVSNARLFGKKIGKGGVAKEDVGLCVLDENGKPNWHVSEQARVLDVDYDNGTLTIERGCHGTEPLAFEAGKAYAATHVVAGPWGKETTMLWYYNFSTYAPANAEGKQTPEILATQIANWFAPGNKLEKFDGIEFDVLHNTPVSNYGRERGIDCDNDGVADDGFINGQHSYGIGVIEFLRRLRELMGNDKLIMADNDKSFHQRGVGILNGVESETWPTGNDPEFEDWAGGINRFTFWRMNSRKPVFNYVARPDSKRLADIRLITAGALICDAGIAMHHQTYGKRSMPKSLIWDEMVKGSEMELGWLGKALGPSERLATKTPNLIKDDAHLKKLIHSANCQIDIRKGTIRLTNSASPRDTMRFELGEFTNVGEDLLVTARVNGSTMKDHPIEMARLMHVEIAGGILPKDWKHIRNFALFNRKPYTAGFYFRQFDKPVSFTFNIQGGEPVTISDVAVYAAPDVMVRKFEKGLVVANPSNHSVEIDLNAIWKGEDFRHFIGTPEQDTITNNGQDVSGKVTIGGFDALFLVRKK